MMDETIEECGRLAAHIAISLDYIEQGLFAVDHFDGTKTQAESMLHQLRMLSEIIEVAERQSEDLIIP